MEQKSTALNDELAALINKSLAGADAAASFLQAQLPDVIHQLLVWHAVSSFLSQALSVAWFIGLVLWVKAGTKNKGMGALHEEWLAGTIGVGFVGSIVFILVFFYNFDWLKIWLAPKIYLLDYVASLVK